MMNDHTIESVRETIKYLARAIDDLPQASISAMPVRMFNELYTTATGATARAKEALALLDKEPSGKVLSPSEYVKSCVGEAYDVFPAKFSRHEVLVMMSGYARTTCCICGNECPTEPGDTDPEKDQDRFDPETWADEYRCGKCGYVNEVCKCDEGEGDASASSGPTMDDDRTLKHTAPSSAQPDWSAFEAKVKDAARRIEKAEGIAPNIADMTPEEFADFTSDESMAIIRAQMHATRLGHCSGCTDPHTEGTHQMGTIEHPEPPVPVEGLEEQAREWMLNDLWTERDFTTARDWTIGMNAKRWQEKLIAFAQHILSQHTKTTSNQDQR